MIAIALDGPAGAGKSTIARALAKQFGFLYVDTGALYRAIGKYAVDEKIDASEEAQVASALEKIRVELKFVQGEQRVFLNQEDVTEKIRTPEISMVTSQIAALPVVRKFLFQLQRELAETNHVVMDGRDIGTVVLPHADLKLFLTASPEERARRRYEELTTKGEPVVYQKVLEEVLERDYQDIHRKTAPLKKAEDAVEVDTTGETVEDSVEKMAALARQRLAL